MALFTVGIFLVTLAYTIFTRNQVKDVETQTAELHKQFVQDERPYVWPTVGFISPVKHQNKWFIVADIEFVNYGKEPALNFTGKDRIVVGQTPPDLDKMFAEFGTTPPSSYGSILAPGKDASTYTNPSAGPFTVQYINSLGSRDDTVYVIGRLWYTDSTGRTYSSSFCVHRLATGARANCATNNETT